MLAGFADEELTTLEAAIVEQHVATCGRCRQIVHDQERVKHVLASCEPPAVEEARWKPIAETLRAELAGTGDPVVLETKPHVEGLEPTPQELTSLEAAEEQAVPDIDELIVVPEEEGPAAAGPAAEAAGPAKRRPPARREATEPEPAERRAPKPTPIPSARVIQRRPPAISVLTVKPTRKRRPPGRVGWGAHFVGALAASLILGICLLAALAHRGQAAVEPIDPGEVARQTDVEFHAVEVFAPNYDIVCCGGNTDDLAGVFVVYRGG